MSYNLSRFVEAQMRSYNVALEEMRAGRKTSHWIWYIFPQMKGLGSSMYSQYYGIVSKVEAESYLSDSLLGARLREISQVVLTHAGKDVKLLMGGGVDAMKLRSSMTLFDAVSPGDVFAEVLETFFGGCRCNRTLKLING